MSTGRAQAGLRPCVAGGSRRQPARGRTARRRWVGRSGRFGAGRANRPLTSSVPWSPIARRRHAGYAYPLCFKRLGANGLRRDPPGLWALQRARLSEPYPERVALAPRGGMVRSGHPRLGSRRGSNTVAGTRCSVAAPYCRTTARITRGIQRIGCHPCLPTLWSWLGMPRQPDRGNQPCGHSRHAGCNDPGSYMSDDRPDRHAGEDNDKAAHPHGRDRTTCLAEIRNRTLPDAPGA